MKGSCRFLTMSIYKGILFRQQLLRLLFWQYKWSTNLLAARTVPFPEKTTISYLLILGELRGEGWYKIVILIDLESLNLPYYWVFCWKSDSRGWIYLQSLVKTPETGVFDADEEAEMDQALFWLHGVYFGSMGSSLTKGTGYEDAQLLGSGILLLGMILLKQT